MTPVRAVVIDPNPLVRSVLRVVLTNRKVRVVGEGSSLVELLDLCHEEGADVVVTDCDLPDGQIDGHVGELRAAGVAVVVFGTDRSPERLTSLLHAGVDGFLLRDAEPESVADSVAAVAGGQVALHPAAAATIVDQWRRLRAEPTPIADRTALTPRERDVLEAMVDGLATKAIAHRLGVATKTVENHKIRVFDKLGVRTQAHAVAIAINNGLLAAAPTGEA